MLTGGCFCGRIRYEAHGTPFHATICHCPDCRRVAGAPFVAWFSLASSWLRFVSDVPKRFASSAKAVRSFCPDCGTPLTFQHEDSPGEIDVTACSLDDPGMVPPQDHVRTNGRVSWVHMNDGLREYAHARSDG
ncbi:MAG: GFA family protein [Acetobacteraceae bacterium]